MVFARRLSESFHWAYWRDKIWQVGCFAYTDQNWVYLVYHFCLEVCGGDGSDDYNMEILTIMLSEDSHS